MSIGEVSDPNAVRAALAEYDAIGRDAFLEKYGFGRTRSYWLDLDGRRYDSKAVLGAAYAQQFPDRSALTAADFSGGEDRTRPILERLGFDVVHDREYRHPEPPGFLEVVAALRTGQLANGGRAPHKPLLLLVALGRCRAGSERVLPATEVADQLADSLRLALPDVSEPSPWEPIWRLEPELWTVEIDGTDPRREAATDPPITALRSPSARCGLQPVVHRALTWNAELLDQMEAMVIDRYLGGVPQEAIDRARGDGQVERRMNVWWVNQGQTYGEERQGGFVWAPVSTKAGHPVAHHTRVSELRAGDVVVHYAGKAIRALSRVVADAERRRKPAVLATDAWEDDGHYCDVEYFDLADPIDLEELVDLPKGQGPFASTGRVNQGYMYEVPARWVPKLRSDFSDRWPAASPWGMTDRKPGTAQPPPSPASGLRAVVDQFASDVEAAGYSFGTDHVDRVRTFVASLATKRFVILTGLSGSGKTKLAQSFGTWLGPDLVKVVAVRPDWTSPDALMGYENGLSELREDGYAWHVPEPLDFMLSAVRRPKEPHVLVLDEMNLAHVERYFADVLSGMESGAPVVPNLTNASGEWRLATDAPARLPFPANVFVVGTVNIDETTYMFSPKVLDRANTIEFRVDTDSLGSARGASGQPLRTASGESVDAFVAASADTAPSSRHEAQFSGWMRELHRLLAANGREFGHRTFVESLRFAAFFESAGSTDPLHALDLQVLQKVLPKYHGSIRELAEPLDRLGAWCFAGPGVTPPEPFDATDPPSGSPPALPRSFDKIRRMAVRLRTNHFVSFAE